MYCTRNNCCRLIHNKHFRSIKVCTVRSTDRRRIQAVGRGYILLQYGTTYQAKIKYTWQVDGCIHRIKVYCTRQASLKGLSGYLERFKRPVCHVRAVVLPTVWICHQFVERTGCGFFICVCCRPACHCCLIVVQYAVLMSTKNHFGQGEPRTELVH